MLQHKAPPKGSPEVTSEKDDPGSHTVEAAPGVCLARDIEVTGPRQVSDTLGSSGRGGGSGCQGAHEGSARRPWPPGSHPGRATPPHAPAALVQSRLHFPARPGTSTRAPACKHTGTGWQVTQEPGESRAMGQGPSSPSATRGGEEGGGLQGVPPGKSWEAGEGEKSLSYESRNSSCHGGGWGGRGGELGPTPPHPAPAMLAESKQAVRNMRPLKLQ